MNVENRQKGLEESHLVLKFFGSCGFFLKTWVCAGMLRITNIIYCMSYVSIALSSVLKTGVPPRSRKTALLANLTNQIKVPRNGMDSSYFSLVAFPEDSAVVSVCKVFLCQSPGKVPRS